MYVCSLYIVWFCSCKFCCLIMDYNLCNLYNCMYVCTYIVDMVCVFVFVCLWGSTFAGLAFCATLSMTKLIII